MSDEKKKDLEGDEARFENEEADVEGHGALAGGALSGGALSGEPRLAQDEEDDDVEAHAALRNPKFKPKL